jgi:thiamine biosynthesis lipoprotein
MYRSRTQRVAPIRLALILWCAAMAIGAVPCASAAKPAAWREARALMGTLVEIQAHGIDEAALRAASAAAYAEMQRLVRMMSHYDPDSVVSEINRRAGVAPVTVPDELFEVLQMAQAVSRATDGAFDVTIGALGWRFGTQGARVPTPAELARRRRLVDFRDLVLDATRQTVFLRRPGMRIDLGGIAKLYILDAGVQVLRARGATRAMINGGGDFVVMAGAEQDPWRIGIHDPRRPQALLGVIELRTGVVASSGDYERYTVGNGGRLHHVIDPATGRPTTGLAQVTLVGPNIACTNGYGAALMVLGYERARRLIERTPGLEGVLVRSDGRVWRSPALRQAAAAR